MRFVALALVLLFSLPVYSETIDFKSGKTITGNIVDQTDKFIKVEVSGVEVKYYLEDIAAIDGQPLLEKEPLSEKTVFESISDKTDKPVEIKIFAVEWNMPEDIRQTINTGIWALQGIYNDIFDFHFSSDFVAKVRIFGDEKYFFGYQRMASTTSSNTGFFTSKTNEAVTYWRKNTVAMLALVFHEVSHALLHNVMHHQPSWIDEGIAEYFESSLVEGDSLIVVPSKTKDRTFKQRLRWNSVMDLPSFLKMSDEEWSNYENLPDNPARGLAWSIVYYLMESNLGRIVLKKTLHHLDKEGDQPRASFQALDLYYPGGVRQLEKDWHEWISKERLLHIYPTNPS
ncbi:MAG: DUF1570 domain-containing protein [Candidatus Omnitrophica bacterium]|nr:DUF1570 domain-containing protein [Candidatus Omnitrophota bacterium]